MSVCILLTTLNDEGKKVLRESPVLSISEMGHLLNRTLWHNQTALTSSLRPWL